MDAINVLCCLIFTLTLIVLVSNVYSIYLGHSDNRYTLFEYLLGATNVFICVALLIFCSWQLYQNNATPPARENITVNLSGGIDNQTYVTDDDVTDDDEEISQDDDEWLYKAVYQTPHNYQPTLSSFKTQANNHHHNNRPNANIHAIRKRNPTITVTKPDGEEEKDENLPQYQQTKNAARRNKKTDQVYEYKRGENPLTTTNYNQKSSFQTQITKTSSPNNDNNNYAIIKRGYHRHQVVPTTNVAKTEEIELSTFKPIPTTNNNNNDNNSRLNDDDDDDDEDRDDDVIVEDEEHVYETIPENDDNNIVISPPELKNAAIKDKSKKNNNNDDNDDNNYYYHVAAEGNIDEDGFEIINEFDNNNDEYDDKLRYYDQYAHNSSINAHSQPISSNNQHYLSTSYYNNNNNYHLQPIYSEPVSVPA